jgi:sugar diacid utilization regulator
MDELLRSVTEQARTLAGATRARLYLREPDEHGFRRVAGEGPAQLGPDHQSADFVVPLGEEGFFLLDSCADTERLAEFGKFAGTVVRQHRMTRRLEARHQELAGRHRALEARHAAERRMNGLVGGDGGLAAIAGVCAELTGKAVALFDTTHRLVTSASPAGFPGRKVPPLDRILDVIGSRPETAVTVAADPARAVARRHLLVPVAAAGETFGWLVVLEYPVRLREPDWFVAERAAEHLAAEFAVQRRIARVAWNARASLARQLVRGSSTVEDLRASGEYLGVDTGARRVLAYVIGPRVTTGALGGGEELASAVERALRVEVLATNGSEGTLLLVEAPSRVGPVVLVSRIKEAVRDAVDGVFGRAGAIVGVSSVCEPSGLARGYREAREVAHCIDRFVRGRSTRVLAVDDLGPARLFVANGDTASIRGYVDDVLGPLLTGDAADLLLTLQSFFDSGRSVRLASAELGVHENTVRLRLAKVRTATGLDVAADANDQLSVQTALLVLRLQGHPALPAIGESVGELGKTRRETA